MIIIGASMKNYIELQHGKNKIIISIINGNQLIVNGGFFSENELRSNRMFDEIKFTEVYEKSLYSTIFICLQTSNMCNLKCSYCFNKQETNEEISIEDAIRFINFVIDRFPNAGKFIVDPTGSSEPLLRMDLIDSIAEFCAVKSNEIKKEVLPMLVTNGTLLTQEKVESLQQAGYIFGISIDGSKRNHNRYRVFPNGQGSYELVMKNTKRIQHKEYLGVAVTLTNEKMNLVKIVKHLARYFPTISIKPVRSEMSSLGINESNVEMIKDNYTRLYNFLLKKTLLNELSYISSLLNGDDYFGKFISRVILNQKVFTRCDASLGRFSLSSKKEILPCPGANGISDLILGNLEEGIIKEKIHEIWSILRKHKACENCVARFVCGGECLVVSYYSSRKFDNVDPIMCVLKKHLFNLAVKFKFEIMINNSELYKVLYEGCTKKSSRFSEDSELRDILLHSKNKYTFLELKKIKDENYPGYIKIKKEYFDNEKSQL